MTLLPESVAMVELAASYVAGKWASDAHAGTLDVTSPTTGELLGTIGVAGREEVDSAVAAARGALPAWGAGARRRSRRGAGPTRRRAERPQRRIGRPDNRGDRLAALLEHVRSGHHGSRRAALLCGDHPGLSLLVEAGFDDGRHRRGASASRRRGRRHRAVEHAAVHRRAQDRPCLGRGLHGGAQASA